MNNGVVRIGRKGLRKFAFGDDGEPFEVDVVVAFQRWLEIDEKFREDVQPDAEGLRIIPNSLMSAYHGAAQVFVNECGGGETTVAEALEFIARLREEYDSLADFFRPKSRDERASPDTSAPGLQFSAEPN